MQRLQFLVACFFSLLYCMGFAGAERPTSFCNPIDLPYRFLARDHEWAGGKSLREAADPTVVYHEGTYWLFASQLGGYFHSKDLVNWTFIEPTGFPVEKYAPTVVVVNGKWLMKPSIGQALYVADDPATGVWSKLRDYPYLADPEIYVDSDERIYLYWGSSPDKPIYGVELDPHKDFDFVGEPTPLIAGLDRLHHGWEARHQHGSDEDIRNQGYLPWMEGATMIKHKGVYYLQYSAPGTEMPEYADGVYTATSPLGPYTYAPYSPFSYKPTGFITSAGHGSTFRGQDGQCWRAVSMLVGVNYPFERRLGIFPVDFLPTDDGHDQAVCNTYLGDYPQLAPGLKESPAASNLAGWMLVSLNKKATASSSLDESHAPSNAFDENIRTSWAAKSGELGEWLQVDLGKSCRLDAIQFNFADVQSRTYGKLKEDAYRYSLEVSLDGNHWKTLVDRKDNRRDSPHEYVQLDRPIRARFAKITNLHTPGNAVFSLSGLRLFGSGLGESPDAVTGVKVRRDTNRRLMTVSWDECARADFYVVRYGIRPDCLGCNFQVYGKTQITLPGLNTSQGYYVAVDSVNDSGVNQSSSVYTDQPVNQ